MWALSTCGEPERNQGKCPPVNINETSPPFLVSRYAKKVIAAADPDQAGVARLLQQDLDDMEAGQLGPLRHVTTMVLAEDFGGNLEMPIYMDKRPGSDFYASNLTMYNFIVCDMNTGENHIFYYEEGTACKGGNTVCARREPSNQFQPMGVD